MSLGYFAPSAGNAFSQESINIDGNEQAKAKKAAEEKTEWARACSEFEADQEKNGYAQWCPFVARTCAGGGAVIPMLPNNSWKIRAHPVNEWLPSSLSNKNAERSADTIEMELLMQEVNACIPADAEDATRLEKAKWTIRVKDIKEILRLHECAVIRKQKEASKEEKAFPTESPFAAMAALKK